MSAVSSWVLSVIGVVILGVLVDIMLPEGQMNKFIKGIFGLITVFVIVSPINTLLNKKIDLTSYVYDSTSTKIDTDFLDSTNKLIKTSLEETLEAKLENGGFSGVQITVSYTTVENVFTVTGVEANIKNLVINTNIPHINKYTEIKEIIMDNLSIKESDITFNE